MIHPNSMTAYAKLDTNQRRREVFKAIYEMKICTRQSLTIHLGWPINRVTGRVRELLDLGHIVETGHSIYVEGRPRAILKVSDEMRERIKG